MQAGMSFAATGSPTIQSGVSFSGVTGLVPRWAISTSTITTFETVFIRDAMQASSTDLATEAYSSTLHSMVHHNATSKSSPLPGVHPTTARWGMAKSIMRSIDTAHSTQAESVLTTSLSENKDSKTLHSNPAGSIPPEPSGDLFGHNIFGPPPSVMSCLYAEAQSSPDRTGAPMPTPELENHKAREHAALHIADILPLNQLLKEGMLKKRQIFGAFFITLNISEDAISLAHVQDLDKIVVVNKPGQVAGGQPSAGGTSSATPHPTSHPHSTEVNVPPVSTSLAVPTTPASTASATTSSTESSSKSTSSKLVLPSTTSTLQTSTESSSPIQSTSNTMASAGATKMYATPDPSTSTVTMITTVYPEDATVTSQGPQRQASLPTATTVGGSCSPERTVRQHTMGEGSMASIQENTVIIHKTRHGSMCTPVSTTTIPHSEGTAIATEDTKTGSITSKRVIPTVSGHPGSFFTTHMPVPTS